MSAPDDKNDRPARGPDSVLIPYFRPTPGADPDAEAEAFADKVVEFVRQYRAKRGLPFED